MTIPKERLGLLFILIGPGGAGKNTLMNYVLSRLDDLKQLPTATTRPIRPTEQHGREHLFLSLDAFQDMIDNGALIEYQEVRPGQYYGVPRSTVQDAIDETRDLIADVDVLGATILNDEYPENTVLIFITPPSMQRLEDQMRERGTAENVIRDRMKRSVMEMTYAPLCDYVIINDELSDATDQLYDVIINTRQGSKATHPANVTYTVTVEPIYASARLARTNGDTLTAPVAHGESPETQARQLIETTFNYEVTAESLTQSESHAVDLIADGDDYVVRYRYTWRLPEKIAAPDGWQWIEAES